jgi:hypothetical protein
MQHGINKRNVKFLLRSEFQKIVRKKRTIITELEISRASDLDDGVNRF